MYKGLELFFLLPLCMCSKSYFNRMWNAYYMKPLPKNMFNLCVQWLLYTGNKVGLDYYKINILIFCIIWPIITLISIALNVILIGSASIALRFCTVSSCSRNSVNNAG